MRPTSGILAAFLPFMLCGCIVADVAETAVAVASVPVKAVSAGVDAATTSQAEADQKRGRELRKAEEARGRAQREMEERCRKGRARPGDVCDAADRR